MTGYREIAHTRCYEYRYDDGDGFVSWVNAGPASPETLAQISEGLPDTPFEVRETCKVADDSGTYIGRLIFAQLVDHQEEP
jgi:hypothetical protein